MLVENIRQAARIENPLRPNLQLVGSGRCQAGAGVGSDGAEAFGDLAFEQREFAFELAFLVIKSRLALF